MFSPIIFLASDFVAACGNGPLPKFKGSLTSNICITTTILNFGVDQKKVK